MLLDNLPLIIPNGRRPWQDHHEKFELFDLSRRKLLLTLISSFWVKGLHLVDVSRLTDKFLLLTLDGINSAEEEKIIDPIILLSPQLYTSGADITFSQQHPISQCDLCEPIWFSQGGQLGVLCSGREPSPTASLARQEPPWPEDPEWSKCGLWCYKNISSMLCWYLTPLPTVFNFSEVGTKQTHYFLKLGPLARVLLRGLRGEKGPWLGEQLVQQGHKLLSSIRRNVLEGGDDEYELLHDGV